MKPITLLSWLAATGSLLVAKTTSAQIYTPSNRIPVADNTLGTQVSGSGNNFNIQGGLNKGQTLFHSFTDFSIPTNGSANFINNPATRDIITRVTGGAYSDLNGKLNSNGANFLLINPNGVVFGPNVQLNVGKAFAASTANGVDLVDGKDGRYTFGTSGNGDAPLLSIDPNVFLNISRLNLGVSAPGNLGIVNYGTLQTGNPGQYIGLIGGNITQDGGNIIAPGGSIELGGLANPGSINWGEQNNFPKLTFPTDVTRSIVTLTGESSVSVAGNGGGNIAITVQDLNVLNGSKVRAGISHSSANLQAGNIVINAIGNIEVGGSRSSSIKNEVAKNGVGNAGDIKIKTKVLNMRNSSEISSISQGNGNGGNISIAADEINLIEFLPKKSSFTSIKTDVVANPTAGDRQGGNITIETRRLNMNNNGHISAETRGGGWGGNLTIETAALEMSGGGYLSTNTFGQGIGGTITVVANDLQIDGPSGISASAYDLGNAGNITIIADNFKIKTAGYLSTGTIGKGSAGNLTIVANNLLSLDDSSKIFAATFDSASAGNLTIATDTLRIKGGSEISTSTYRGIGKAGDLIVKANTVEIDGESHKPGGGVTSSGLLAQVDPSGKGNGGTLAINTNKLIVSNGGKVQAATFGKGNGGSLAITATDSVVVVGTGSSLNVGVGSGAVGNGGELKLKTPRLVVKDGGTISTSSAGTGVAGKLDINASTIDLQHQGLIIAETQSGKGGNIELTLADYLLLRGNSRISATAGTAQQGGDGGNINITSPLIIATPGNNDITANAYTGNGGKVIIFSDGLFGIEYRGNGLGSDFTNDITASSTFGQSGTVSINTPGTEPGKGSTELPNAPNDASNQISQVCGASTRENKLILAGRGGLPPNASDNQESEALWQDPREPQTQTATTATLFQNFAPPAVGMVFDGKGKATLVAANASVQTGTKPVCPQQVGK